MDYATLTEDQKNSIVDNHIAQVEQQHYSAGVQQRRAQAAGREEEAAQLLELQQTLETERDELVALRTGQ